MKLLVLSALLLSASGGEWRSAPPVTLQSGHSANISALAFSPDGKFLVSASEDATLKLWDPMSGAEMRTLRGHANIVTAVAITADSSSIASASLDRTLKVWNARTGEQVASFPGPNPAVNLLKFTPDGTSLVTAETISTGTILRLWNIKSTHQIRMMKREDAAVSNIFFSADGRRMLVAEESGDDDSTGAVTSFNLATGRQLETQKVLLCGASEDGKWLALDHSNELERRAIVVDSATNKTLAQLSGQVSRVVFTANGWLAYESASGESAVVQRAGGGSAHTIRGHSAEFSMLALSPDGQLLATTGPDFSIHIWDVASGKLAHGMSGQYTPSVVAFSPDGRRIAANGGGVDLGNALQIWDLARETLVPAPRLHNRVIGMAFSNDGSQIAVSSPSLEIFDARSFASLRKFSCSAPAYSPVMSPNNKLIAANCGGIVTIWSVDTGAEVWHFGNRSDSSNPPLVFSGDSKLLAGASDTGLFICDVAAQHIVQSVKTANPVAAIAFHPSSEALALGTRVPATKPDEKPAKVPPPPASVVLLDLHEHRRLWKLPAGEWVSGLKFTRDARNLLVISGDDLHKAGWLTVVDAAKGHVLRQLAVKVPGGNPPAFSSDAGWFAVGANSATYVWRIQ